jgi:cell division protease FtsH
MAPEPTKRDRGRDDEPERRKPTWKVDPAPDGRGAPKDEKPPVMPRGGRWWTIILIVLTINLVISFATGGPEDRTRVPYQPFFVEQLERGNVAEIASRADTIEGRLERAVRYDPPGERTEPVDVERFETEVPTFVEREELTRELSEQGVIVNATAPDDGRNPLLTLLFGFAPAILIIAFFIWLYRKQMGAQQGGPLGQFGRSRARRIHVEEKTRISFDDVAGIDEAEAELVEIVDFLKNPDKYRALGARIPRGVLLAGPPGTGKTLLARAVAGEAGAPFFSISASEFVEAIVGVGASRVRDLFKQAKEAAPAIIFIDELDAIGRSRTNAAGGFSGGNDEREQTLNQILTEMDGFEGDEGVIVLGATNRPEILDKALLRPGRFDRRIYVQTPDRDGRAQILRIHTRSVPLADDVDLDLLAASTPGMSGADLALLVNEAALFAARRGHDKVRLADFTDAIEKTVLGAERQIVMSHADRERTAYHEAGHALVGMLTEGADPVRKISIIPRGRALGVTLSTPDADRYGYERDELRGRIKVMLGGRAAELVVYGELTTGAESDIQQLTQLARGMVARWGMSERIGPVAVTATSAEGMLLPGAEGASEQTQREVDEEVRRIVDDAESETIALLERERERLDALARALLDRETLDQREAYEVAGLPVPTRAENEEADRRPAPEGEVEPGVVAPVPSGRDADGRALGPAPADQAGTPSAGNGRPAPPGLARPEAIPRER